MIMKLTYGFILRALCCGMIDWRDATPWWVSKRSRDPYFQDCFGVEGISEAAAAYMILHHTEEVPADELYPFAS